MTDTGKFGHAPDRNSAFLELNGIDGASGATSHRAFLGGGHFGDQPSGSLRLFRADLPAVDLGAVPMGGASTGDLRLYGRRGFGDLRLRAGADGNDPNGGVLALYHQAAHGGFALRTCAVLRAGEVGPDSPAGFLELYSSQPEPRVQLGTDVQGRGFIELRGYDRTVRIDETGVQVSPNKMNFVAFAMGAGHIPPFTWDFVADHPTDPDKEIHYCVVEAPEVGVFVRGTAWLEDGRAAVRLPDHFAHVANADKLTVQLTPRCAESLGLAATSVSVEELVIQELASGRGSYEVDYLVHGVRRGCEHYEVVRVRPRHQDAPSR